MEVLRKEGLTGRRGQEQSPRGLLPCCQSSRLPERVGPGLGVGPPRGAVGPLVGRCWLPDPRGQRFPQRRRTPSVLGEKPSAFLHAVLCRVLCVCVCVRAWRLVGRMPRAARGSPWAWPWAGACTRPRNKLKVPVETGGSGVHLTGPGGASSVHTPLLTAWC